MAPTACQVALSTAYQARIARACDAAALTLHEILTAVIAARVADRAPGAAIRGLTDDEIDSALSVL